MKKFLALSIAFTTAFAPVCSFAQEAIGTLTYTEGRVDRTQEGAFDYVPVVKEEEVHSGDVLRTKSASMAEVRFKDGSTVRLGENTQLRIPQYALDADGKRSKAQLFVDRGVVRAIVEKAKDKQANFLIDTPNMRGAIKGSDIVVGFERSITNLVSFEGIIQAQSVDFPDGTVTVTPGKTSAVSSSAPPAQPRKFLDVEKQRFESQTSPKSRAEQKDPSKAVITKYTGDVRVKTQGARDWHRAGLKEALGEGDQIETGENGSATILLESGRSVDLKAKTQLGIQQLKVDPKTGFREDVLQSMGGELRARIDKFKGRETSFRVVTPTAIASVRGTILYLQVMPKKVTSYFEQGHGSLLGLLKNVESDVQPGQAAAIGETGDLEGPYIPSDDEVQRYRSDWGDEQYGYSPSGSGQQGSFEGTDEGGPDTNAGTEQNNLFDQVQQQQPDLDEKTDGPAPILIAEWGNERQDASLYNNDSGDPDWSGEEFGRIDGIAPWDAPQSFTALGEFFDEFGSGGEEPSEAPAMFWHTQIGSRTELPPVAGEGDEELETQFSDATVDGGAVFGHTAGIWNNGTLIGSLAAIFVGPAGNAGLLTGFLEGAFDRATGLWSAVGQMTPSSLSQMDGIDTDNFREYIEYGYLSGALNGGFLVQNEETLLFEQTGYLGTQTLDATTNFLWDRESHSRSETWGVYDFFLGGYESEFYNPQSLETFAGVFGGRGVFGRFLEQGDEGEEDYDTHDDNGFWLGFAGGTWSDGEVHGLLEAVYITRTQMGVLGGDFWAIADLDESGTWSGASAGTFVGQELALAGTWGDQDPYNSTSFYYNDGGYLEWAGEEYGYFGSIKTPWDAPVEYTAIGTYYVEGDSPTDDYDRLLWISQLRSSNPVYDDESTPDGGAFYGYTAGLWRDGALNGSLAALYVDPTGRIGLLTGGAEGEFFEELDMWFATGTLTADPLATWDEPEAEYFSEWITRGSLEGGMSGWYLNEDGDGVGYLEPGGLFRQETRFFNVFDEGSDHTPTFGLLSFRFDEGEYDNPDYQDTWRADIGGWGTFGQYADGDGYSDDDGYWLTSAEGDWDGGQFTGPLAGIYVTRRQVGRISGDVYGLYDTNEEDHTFAGGALAAYSGDPIEFSGEWGRDQRSLYVLNYNQLDYAGEEYGWIGAAVSPWNSENLTSRVFAIGNFDLECAGAPLVWDTPFESVNVFDGDGTTYDGGSFWGYTQGLWGAEGDMHGSVATLFYDGDGRGGVLRGGLDGRYSEELGLWGVEGDVAAIRYEDVDGLDADWLEAYIEAEEMTVNAAGRFVSVQDEQNYFQGSEESDYSYLRFFYPDVYDLERTPTFGIFDMRLEGDGLARPGDADKWEAVFGGSGTFGYYDGGESYDEGDWYARGTGTWSDGGMSGSFEGAYMTDTQFGVIEGDIYGLSDEEYDEEEDTFFGDWAASGLGSFVGQPLDFAGRVEGGIFDFDSFEGMFDEEGEGCEDCGDFEGSEMSGRMGGFGDLWASASQAVPVHFLGYFEGGSDEGARLFLNVFTSYNVYQDEYSTFDGGMFVGFTAGRWAGEHTAGHLRGFYASPEGVLGFFSGSLTGTEDVFSFDGEDDESGMWRLDGTLRATPMGLVEEFEGFEGEFNLDDLFEEFEASLVFSFHESENGEIGMLAIALSPNNENDDHREWGLWFGFLQGELANVVDGSSRHAMGGVVFEDDEFGGDAETAFLGTLRSNILTVQPSGSGDVGTVDSAFRGVWISVGDNQDPFLRAGSITGDFAGDFDRQPGEGGPVTSFEAAGVGEFAAMAELDPEKLGFDIDTLQNFISQPITESHAGLLSAVGGGIQGTMDASFFANGPLDTGGIWAAIFNGTFLDTPGTTWNFSNGDISATLNNVQWTDGSWLADVTGTLPGVSEGFTGQAGGSFTNPLEDLPGSFTGVGAGAWGTGPSEPAVD